MVAPPPETVEVLYYDREFTRLHRLETHVPQVGEEIGEYRVRNVRFGGGKFLGHRMVYVYLESTGVK